MAQQMRSAQPVVSPESYQIAGMYNLGAPLAEYQVNMKRIITATILCVLGTALFGFLTYTAAADANAGTGIVFLLFTLACGAGVVYYVVVYPLVYRSWRVYACSEGFAFAKGGSDVAVFRWDQIAGVWQRIVKHYRNGIYTGTTYRYTIRRTDGVQAVLTERFARVEQLGTLIQREVTSRLTPAAIASFNAGYAVPFGSISVSKQGVTNGKKAYAWQEIREIGANRGYIFVQRHGERGKNFADVASVPNFFVFLNLVNAVLKGQRA